MESVATEHRPSLPSFVRTGRTYAQDLQRVAANGASPSDLTRVEVLARYLAQIHVGVDDAIGYRRAIRELVGGADGIFGIVDRFPTKVAGVSTELLQRIECHAAEWRWTLRAHEGRACRTHGELRPHAIVFDGDRLVAPDTARGATGEAADDVAALAIQFLVVALDQPNGWCGAGALWHRFWKSYRAARPDPSLTYVIPPFIARHALVATHPDATPRLSPAARDALLGFVEAALEAGHFEPGWADELFT